MKRNVCGPERIARVVVGAALIALALRGGRERPGRRSLGRLLALAYGVELITTAVVRFCPTNYALGINTCEAPLSAEVRDVLARAPPRPDPLPDLLPI